MSLDKVGINSLIAVNNWIGIIDGNLQSASRTGYKTVRANMTDGLGINRVQDEMSIPPATLTVQSTQVEWGQGSIVNSDYTTDFALSGEGFFVLHDPLGDKYYLSRDGEFHWDNQGYLVNSSGLRVVSAGQDYIRYGDGDASDMFSQDAYSRDLTRYGDKSFLLVDVLNRDNLRMSKYGSTVFELDGDVTTRVQNDFTKTTDGLTFVYDDPIIQSVVPEPGFVYQPPPPNVPNTDFTIDFGNGLVYDTTTRAAFGGAFDPSTHTLQDVLTDLQNFALAAGTLGTGERVLEVNYDQNDDTLTITHRVLPGQNNTMTFGGVNGQAIRRFFRLPSDGGGQTDELTTPNFDANIVTSQSDIDISSQVPYKDIGFPLFAGPPPHGAVPLNTTFYDLTHPQPVYTHNKTAGYVESQAAGGNSIILAESAQTSQFDLVMDLKIEDTGLFLMGFGQSDAHSLNSGGFDIVYNPTPNPINLNSTLDGTTNTFPTVIPSGSVLVRQKPNGYDITNFSTRTLDNIQNLGPAIGLATGTLNNAGSNSSRVAVTLNADHVLTFAIGSNVATFDLGQGGQSLSGSLTLRNAVNTMQISNLHLDMKRDANAVTTGEMTSVGILDIANVDQPGWDNRPRTYIKQNALESSTASLTEYIPMLGLAQKVFSAVSKIISTYNQSVDDLNSLIR